MACRGQQRQARECPHLRHLPRGSHSRPGSVQLSEGLLKGRRRWGKGSSSPGWRFAKLRSTMRGHSHPTVCEELEKGGEARPASPPVTAAAAAAITGIHIHHRLTKSAHQLGERQRPVVPPGPNGPGDTCGHCKKHNAHETTTSGLFQFISANTKREDGLPPEITMMLPAQHQEPRGQQNTKIKE